jgi:hypothetical protein
MKRRTTTTSFRSVSYLLTLLLTLGQAPAFAASAAPAGKPTVDVLASEVTSLQTRFQAELANTNLSLVGAPKVEGRGEPVSHVTFLATAPLDLSRSGRLVHAKEYYLASTDRVSTVAATQEVQVDVNLETQHVDVTTVLGFNEAFDGRDGHPLLQGLKIENVVEIPLEEYRQAASAAEPQQAFQELAQKLQARETAISHTTVTLPNGRRTTFRGTEMTLGQALNRAIRGSDAMTQVSWRCVRACFEDVNMRLSLPRALCAAAVVAGCGTSCFFVGPACIACFQYGFIGCGIGVQAVLIVRLIQCLLNNC